MVDTASADTLVSGGTTTVTDPVDFAANAGTVTIDNTGTLYFVPNQQGNYSFGNNFVLAGTAGTINLRFQKNDTIYTFHGPVTSDPAATGPQTLAIATGVNNNGDREEVTFVPGIPDVFDASPLSLSVNFSTQSESYSFVNLLGNNTFTGPISLAIGVGTSFGYLTIGGRGIGSAGNTYNVTPGTGTLNGGNYDGDISIGRSTLLSYASTTDQILSGHISGVGSLWKEGSSVLTLSGASTFAGNTTVRGGTLLLDSAGSMSFTVTNSSSNKITGAGTATLNGTFDVDTSAVTAAVASWTLVDVTNRTFGGSFRLTGFDPPVGTEYKKTEGGKIWTFDSSTGVLSLVTKALITSMSYNGLSASIDNENSTINLPVVNGTVFATVAPAFTVSSGSADQTSGAVPSPAFDGVTPVDYVVTDAPFTTTYAVSVTELPLPPGGVGGDLKVWLRADAVNTGDASQVRVSGPDSFIKQWIDVSGNGLHASNTSESQQPRYIADGLNGEPSLRFVEANFSRLFMGDLSAYFGAGVDPTPTAVNSGSGGASINGTYLNLPTRGVAGALVDDADTATSFNGTNEAVEIPYSAALNPPQGDPWTAEIWAKSNISGVLPPFSSGTPGNVPNRQGWVLYFFNSDLSFRAYTNNGANATINGANGLTIPGIISPGTWYHVAVTCDGTDFRIYLNGVEVGTTPTVGPNGTYSAGTTGTSLGSRLGAGNWFNGTLDEAAFYTTTLSQARLQAHYENGINDPTRSQSYDLEIATDSPVAHYKLNEAAGPLSEATIFAVGKVGIGGTDNMYSMFGNRNNDERWLGGNWNEVTPGAFRGGRANFSSEFARVPDSGSHIFAYESSSTAYKFLLNGEMIGTTGGNYNAGGGKNWVVGTNGSGNGADLNGDIAELIIYNRVLTAVEANQVGAYLAKKYGLTTAYVMPDTDYDTWSEGYLPDDVSDPAADFDNDGLTNLQEYAFGLNAILGTSLNPIIEPLDKTTGIFKYNRRATPETAGLTYTVLTSTDLVTWTPDAGATESVTTLDEVETVEVTLSAALLTAQKLFIRVEASPKP